MALNNTERDALVERIGALKRRLYADQADVPLATERALNRELEQCERDYMHNLPERMLSRCPHCDTPLMGRIDAYGLDGPFWNAIGVNYISTSCAHYLTHLGALRYGDQVPALAACGWYNEIHSGPEVPYLVPALLRPPETKAVLSCIELVGGRYRAYLIGYFAAPPLPAQAGHQVWLRQAYYYADEQGHVFRQMRTDPWDFALPNWLRQPPWRLGWIAPDDPRQHIRTGLADCPYLNLPGRRGRLVLRRGLLRELPPPDGQELTLFD